LATEMLSSSLCLYPNDFWETFCLTALETQAAGVPMITTKLGALSTTLSGEGNVLIKGDPHSAEYTKEFIASTVVLLTTRRDILDDFSKKCLVYFKYQPDWEKVAIMWEDLIYHL
jgi:glycosyltransferase involved in cell wall biosynthesis